MGWIILCNFPCTEQKKNIALAQNFKKEKEKGIESVLLARNAIPFRPLYPFEGIGTPFPVPKSVEATTMIIGRVPLSFFLLLLQFHFRFQIYALHSPLVNSSPSDSNATYILQVTKNLSLAILSFYSILILRIRLRIIFVSLTFLASCNTECFEGNFGESEMGYQ